jgi:dienelactone hydrolase
MDLARTQTKWVMCVAVLGVGCVNETYDRDEVAEAVNDGSVDSRAGQGKFPRLPLALPKGGKQPKVVGVAIGDVTLPAGLHAQGLAVPAKLARPIWSEPVGPGPAVLVLHGSGGLLKQPGQGDEVCSPDMESQFQTWAERLAERGYVVLLPSSYSARGFCDKHKDPDKIPSTFDDKPEQILGRLYDVDAASRYMCDLADVDCERMGVLGFSQGGTMTMLAVHWQVDQALAHFRDTKGDTVDIEIPDLAPGRPEFQVGVAYYPGCGFDGVVPLSTGGKAALENKFFAAAPLSILHGSEDALVEHCSVKHGPGEREVQSGEVAQQLATADTYELTVYADAGHSFDTPSVADGGTDAGNAAAQEAALAIALARLAEHLQ